MRSSAWRDNTKATNRDGEIILSAKAGEWAKRYQETGDPADLEKVVSGILGVEMKPTKQALKVLDAVKRVDSELFAKAIEAEAKWGYLHDFTALAYARSATAARAYEAAYKVIFGGAK